MPSWQSSMGILGLFRLNGAFLLLPSILSLLVVMTVILDHSIIIFLRVGGIVFFIFVLYSHGAWNTAKKVSLQWRYLVVFTTVLKRIHLSRVFWLCVLSLFLMLWLINLFLIGLCLLFIQYLPAFNMQSSWNRKIQNQMVLMYLKNKTDPKENVLLLNNFIHWVSFGKSAYHNLSLLVISSKIEKDIK